MTVLPRLTSVALLLFATCFSSLAQNTFTDSEASDVKAFLHDNFNGKKDCIVIGLIDEHGSQVFGGGSLDNGTTNLVNGDSVFLIGSITKTLTALLLQDMADRGEVKLDGLVALYLPKRVKMPMHGGKQITLLNLATHTAGFPHDADNMTGKDWQEQFETYTADKMYAYLSKFNLSRDPGSEYEYSNFGAVLLGHVLSLRAGTNFESLLLDRICRPLRMDHTRISLTAEMESHLAMGHRDSGEPYPPAKLDLYAPAGGVHSTANDLLKYLSAQAGLTRSSLTPSIEKTHVIRYKDAHGYPGGTETNYYGNIAMPWMQRGDPSPAGMDLLGHAGGAGSYHGWVGFDMQQRRGVVALTTSSRFSIEDVGQAALRRKGLRDNIIEISPEIVGIGAALKLDDSDHRLHITSILAHSPASQAGLLAGVIIDRIDGIPTASKSLVECVTLIRGQAGTKVRLELITGDGSKTNTMEITRGKLQVAKR
ncbi:MAG TPA: serine hydrolase [Candidatus Dormibacteraeota bacterium]|nr:serine hydrolase [Candidatus Dormibacteraeota bacterium]